MSTFGRNIYNDKITLKEADEYQSCLFVEIINFKSKINMKNLEKFLQKNILKNLYALFDGRERVLNVFERKIFLTQLRETRSLTIQVFKILSYKQMFQRISTVLAQIKADNTSENLLNEIRQIIYFL